MSKPTSRLSPAIAAEVAALQSQIDRLDLADKHTREQSAMAAHAQCEVQHISKPWDVNVEGDLRRRKSELDVAKNQRTDAEREARHMTREVVTLTAMLTAGDRVVQAQKRAQDAADLVAAARVVVDSAVVAQTEINQLIAAEELAIADAQTQAGAALLAQIKTGSKGDVPTVSRDRLAALVSASVSATAELLAAQGTLSEHVDAHSVAQHDLAEAKADVTARTLHLAVQAYVAALVAHESAAENCGRHFDPPDLATLCSQYRHQLPTTGSGDDDETDPT